MVKEIEYNGVKVTLLKGSEILGSPESDCITRICISLLPDYLEIKHLEINEASILINVHPKRRTK